MKKDRAILILTILASILCLSTAEARAEAGWGKEMHYADTLHTQWKIDQFLKAVDIAPGTWVYRELVWQDAQTVTIFGMRFNDSMVKTLQSEIVLSDEGLKKRMTRLHKLTKALNATLDLTIGYKKLPEGLAISYDIANLKIGGGRKDD